MHQGVCVVSGEVALSLWPHRTVPKSHHCAPSKTLGKIPKHHELNYIVMAAQFKEYTQVQVIIRQADAFYVIVKGGA